MLVISSNLVIADASDGLSLDHPVIGWRNVVTIAGVTADSELPAYPATNLANPATNLRWQAADIGEHFVVITTNEVDAIDYVAVAKHNFATAEIPVSIEGFIDGEWVQIVDEVMLPDDGPALFRFVAQSLSQVRIRMQEGIAAPRAAVVYCGKLLVLERKIWVGHTPMPHGRRVSIVNNVSETGEYLGAVVLGAWRETSVPLSLISPAWYRAKMDAFLAAAVTRTPFFFAWRPQSYPREVGYGWLMEEPKPAPVGPSNLLALDLKISGVA
ncbi:MAG: hypothetical protein ACOY6K_05425 [Pseudomonadota bacterium]